MILRFPSLLLLLSASSSFLPPTFLVEAQAEEECAVFLFGESDSFTNDDLAPITINTDEGLCYATLTWPQIELDFDEDSTVTNDDDSGGCCNIDRKNRRGCSSFG